MAAAVTAEARARRVAVESPGRRERPEGRRGRPGAPRRRRREPSRPRRGRAPDFLRARPGVAGGRLLV